MTPLPVPPPEVPVRNDVALLAPRFQIAVRHLLMTMRSLGHPARVAETLRDDARQRYLYGFGREYDDGRGIVTKAATVDTTWHGFGLAADIVHETKDWDAPVEFWTALGDEARKLALAWGGDWESADKPHVQWGAPMRKSPSPLARQIVNEQGMEALWRTVGAAT